MPVDIITTVMVAAASSDLTTLTAVKDELGISDGSQDAFLTRAIRQCSRIAANYCNRVFAQETVQDQCFIAREPWPNQTPGGSQFLQLSRWPVTSITSVVEAGITLTAVTDYVAANNIGRLTRVDSSGCPVYWPPTQIVVTYQAGYVLPGSVGATLPDDIEGAVISLVRGRYYAKGRDPSVKSEETPGVLRTDYWVGPVGSGAMPSDVQAILDDYRVPVFA